MAVETAHAELVEQYLRRHNPHVEVAPLEVQQADDIDFLFRNKADEVKSVEVKYDQQGHRTGNVAFETVSNELTPTRGCFLRTKADWFFYCLVATGELLIMETEPTRSWFIWQLQHRRDLPFREYTTRSYDRRGLIFPSRGWLVPITTLVNEGLIIRRVHLQTEQQTR